MKNNHTLRTASVSLFTAAMLLCASLTLNNLVSKSSKDTKPVFSQPVSCSSLTVTVADAQSSRPIRGAKVMLIDTGEILLTDSDGKCTFSVAASKSALASIAATKSGYAPYARYYIEVTSDRSILASLSDTPSYTADLPGDAFIASNIAKIS